MSYPNAYIGDVATIVTGKTPSTKDEANFGGAVPFVTPADLDLEGQIVETPRTLSERGASKMNLVPENSILVCCIGSLGKVGIAGKELATNQQINAVVFDESKVSPRFGYYALKLLKHKMEAIAPATTVKIISKSKFSELDIPLPPLDEQKRIAAILDQTDALRRLRQRAIDRLNTLGQSIFHEMFVVPEIPDISLVEVCEKITDGTHQTPTYADSGVTFLSAKNVTKRRIDWNNIKYIPQELHDEISKRIIPRRDDILLAKNGTTGVAAKVDTDEVFSIYVSLALLRPLSVVRPDYLLFAINHENTKRQFDGSLKGVGVSNLHLKDIRSALIPLPAIELQDRFIERVKGLAKVEGSFQKAADSSSELFHSLQHRAFRGEL